MKPINEVTGEIIAVAMKIHSKLGPGLLESVYSIIMAHELSRRGFEVERQKPVAFDYEGMHFNEGFRADLVVDGLVIVEVKAVTQLAPVHSRQVLTYLRLLNCPVGLLINFGVLHLRDGIQRIANGPLPFSVPPAASV